MIVKVCAGTVNMKDFPEIGTIDVKDHTEAAAYVHDLVKEKCGDVIIVNTIFVDDGNPHLVQQQCKGPHIFVYWMQKKKTKKTGHRIIST